MVERNTGASAWVHVDDDSDEAMMIALARVRTAVAEFNARTHDITILREQRLEARAQAVANAIQCRRLEELLKDLARHLERATAAMTNGVRTGAENVLARVRAEGVVW